MWLRMLPCLACSNSSLTSVERFRPTCTVAWPQHRLGVGLGTSTRRLAICRDGLAGERWVLLKEDALILAGYSGTIRSGPKPIGAPATAGLQPAGWRQSPGN